MLLNEDWRYMFHFCRVNINYGRLLGTARFLHLEFCWTPRISEYNLATHHLPVYFTAAIPIKSLCSVL